MTLSTRSRIIVSRSEVNLVKWSCLLVQAICMLIAIAMVHSDNRRRNRALSCFPPGLGPAARVPRFLRMAKWSGGALLWAVRAAATGG
jgi:hypothetical protein